jgi:hypothetical protein
MLSKEFVVEAHLTDPKDQPKPGRKMKPRKQTPKMFEDDQIEEGIGKVVGAGVLGAAALTGGTLGIKAGMDKLNEPTAQVQQSTQKKPDIKAPTAKKAVAKKTSNWESHTYKDEMDGTSTDYKTLTSTDSEAKLILSSEVSLNTPSQIGNVNINGGQFTSNFRIKLDGALQRHEDGGAYFGAIIKNKETMSGIFLGYTQEESDLIKHKIMSAKSAIQIEVTLYGKGTKIFTFNP